MLTKWLKAWLASFTGIIVGTEARKALTQAFQKTMSQPDNPSETINRLRGVLLIEDGENPGRLEVVSGRGVVPPVEEDPFSLDRLHRGLKKI